MPKIILIVNDEEDVAEVTKDMLEAEGFETVVAYSGEDALKWLSKHRCDLVLLDILMPEMGGDDVCKQMRSNLSLKNIPVVLFSANSGDEEKILKETGAEDYISIPYDPEELISKINKLVA